MTYERFISLYLPDADLRPAKGGSSMLGWVLSKNRLPKGGTACFRIPRAAIGEMTLLDLSNPIGLFNRGVFAASKRIFMADSGCGFAFLADNRGS